MIKPPQWWHWCTIGVYESEEILLHFLIKTATMMRLVLPRYIVIMTGGRGVWPRKRSLVCKSLLYLFSHFLKFLGFFVSKKAPKMIIKLWSNLVPSHGQTQWVGFPEVFQFHFLSISENKIMMVMHILKYWESKNLVNTLWFRIRLHCI